MTTNDPNVPTPEQEAAVIEAMRKNAASNPASIPPQFGGDVDKFIDAYKNLQADYTKKSQELATFKKAPVETPKPAAEPPKPLHIPDAVVEETPQVSWDTLQTEFQETGDISEDSKKALVAALKLPDTKFVDAYINGLKSQRQLAMTKAVEIAGNSDEYNKVLAWASKTMDVNGRAALNQALSSPSWELTWTGLVAQYKTAAKSSANMPLNAPVGNDTTEVQPYRTHQEYMKDLADPRYRHNQDPDFVDLVLKRANLTAKLASEE